MSKNLINVCVSVWIGISIGIFAKINVIEKPIEFFCILIPVIILNSFHKE